MGIWSRIFGRQSGDNTDTETKSDSTIGDWFREFGQSMTSSGIAVNQTMAMKVTAVMACVRLRSQDVAKLPPKIWRLKSDGSKSEARDHFLYQIFREPNNWQTWFEFMELMQMALLLRGNAYAAVLRNPRGMPVAMIPINPDMVSIFESPTGLIFYQVSRGTPHQVATLASFPTMISADDIFHIRWASQNSLIGLSPIALHAETIGLAKAQERLSANIMGNGARPAGVLSTEKKLNKDVIERLKNQWQALHGGPDAGRNTAILEEGLKWQALTLNSVDMEFMASRQFQVEECCRVFSVNPAKVGVLQSGIGKAFEQIQLAYYSDCISPDLVRWEQKLETYFGLDDTLDIKFDETELLRTDLVSRANAARVMQVSGIATPNESRATFGFDPYPGGDVLLVPNNVVPLHMAGMTATGSGPGSDQTGAPADGGDGDPASVVEPTG